MTGLLLDAPEVVRPSRSFDDGVAPPRRVDVVALLAIIVAEQFVLADLKIPLLSAAVGLMVLVGVPVWVLMKRVTWDVESSVLAFLYSFGITVLGAMVVGFVLNAGLAPLGVDRPLALAPLVLTSTVINCALVLWRRDRALVEPGAPRALVAKVLAARFEPAVTTAVVGLILCVLGAIRLNNDRGVLVALLGHSLLIVAMVIALIKDRGIWRDATVVYVAGAGLLLGTSLRGWVVTGHDIQREYVAFLITHQADRWFSGSADPTYNACLSLNIWPHLLAQFTGLSGEVVFKVLMQLVGALLPVAVLMLSRRLVVARLALLGTVAFLVFPTFQTDLPYLNRQQLAFIFQALTFLAATQPAWTPQRRRGLGALFGLGVVVSHYSTTYLLVMTLGIGFAVLVSSEVYRRLRPRRHRAQEPNTALTLLHPSVVLLIVLGTWVWTSMITHSGGQMASVLKYSIVSTFKGGGGAGSSDLTSGIFAHAAKVTPQERLDGYVRNTLAARAGHEDQLVYSNLTPAELTPKVVDEQLTAPTVIGSRLQSAGVPVERLNVTARSLSAAAMQLCLLVGSVVLLVRGRRASQYHHQTVWLTYGAMGALATVVLVPGISPNYGVLRAMQQTLIMCAPVFAIGMVTIMGVFRSKAEALAIAAVAFMAVAMTSVLGTTLGSYQGQLAMARSGLYFDQFYATPSEVAALRWAGKERLQGGGEPERIISDASIVSQFDPSRRMDTSNDLYPTVLPRNAYVFLSSTNLIERRATIFWTGDLLTYTYPVAGLDERLDIVFSTGNARVYH